MNNVYTTEELLALIRRLPKPIQYGEQIHFLRLSPETVRVVPEDVANSTSLRIQRAIASKHPDNPSELRWLIADVHVIL